MRQRKMAQQRQRQNRKENEHGSPILPTGRPISKDHDCNLYSYSARARRTLQYNVYEVPQEAILYADGHYLVNRIGKHSHGRDTACVRNKKNFVLLARKLAIKTDR